MLLSSWTDMLLIITVTQSKLKILTIFWLGVKVRFTFPTLKIFINPSNIISNFFDLYHF